MSEATAGPGGKEEFTWNSFGAHFVEVEVHVDTREVRIAGWTGVFDAGRILNPMLARSQIQGAILFGIGMALLEESLYEPISGSPVNADLSE